MNPLYFQHYFESDERLRLTTSKLLFVWCTWGFLVFNLLIAWLDSISSMLLFSRDLWIFLFTLLLIQNKRYVSIAFVASLVAFGVAPLVDRFDVAALQAAFYGVRDLFLYFLLAEMLILAEKGVGVDFNERPFVRLVLLLCIIELLCQSVLGLSISNLIFNTDKYFLAKGVSSNLSTGFFIDRLSIPFYSPALVCTLLSLYFLLGINASGAFIQSTLAFIVCVFTVSKVLVFVLLFRLVGRYWGLAALIGVTSLPFIYSLLSAFVDQLNVGFLSYHLGSVTYHLKAFFYAAQLASADPWPSLIGTHSVAGKNFLGVETYTIESSFLARLLDLKYFGLIFLGYICYVFLQIRKKTSLRIFTLFLALMALTATSNHPVAFFPLLALVAKQYKNRS